MYHFGIIGAGNIAHKFIEAVRMTKNADVTAVASKSLERARDWAEKEGLSRYYDSYETLLADPDIDIIYIAHYLTLTMTISRRVWKPANM